MKRIAALDSIRGLLLLLMTINHLIWVSGGYSIIQNVTLQPLGQFGAAECFVFISGLLAGVIYSRDSLTNQQITTKAFHRAFSIYRYHVSCLLVVFVWFFIASQLLPSALPILQQSAHNVIESPIETLLASAVLVNQPSYFDILPLYIVFMLLLPFLVRGYRKGLGWLIISISIGIWFFSSTINATVLQPLFDIVFSNFKLQLSYFNIFAWQLLFVSSSLLGFMLQNKILHWRHPVLTVLAVIIAVGIFAAHHGAFVSYGINRWVLYSYADKPELGWLRTLNIAVWVYLIAVIIQRNPSALHIKALSYIGRHSLRVFSWQIVVVYLSAPLLHNLRLEPYYIVVVIVISTSLWFAAWLSEKKWANKTKIQHWVSYVTVIFLIAITTNYVSAQAVSPLTIKISNLVDSKTPITVLVYDEKDDLNGRATVHYKKYSPQQVIEGITVESLPAGNYAILAFQDKDENYYLTRNNDGMPVEYFGLSNNPVLQGSLVMEQIKFSHHKSQTQTINFY
ncbi:OpgC domain-containing protein [Photobacterium kishitanii]|uniref:OpgC domain-containing protein n=1 Tax=Photobacterium kishitanii TaxID=318456 RepID=UPI000434D824|nr:OpgC domain-containing protein [Photobacterium kishitanii]CEO40740.1 OpgC protein [Photobacterium kishitanii]